MNMSYCRFQNTLTDLRDCKNALEEILGNDTDTEVDALSRDEEEAAIDLISLANDIVLMIRENLGLGDRDDLTDSDIAAHIRSSNQINREAEQARRQRDKAERQA
jgi:hypothetical protein